MILEKKHLDTATIVFVEGLIKLGESAHFFQSAINSIPGKLVIDFTKIDYMDSTGLGELVAYCSSLTKRDPKPVFVNSSHRILKLFQLTKLDRELKIFDNRKDALASLN